MVPNMKRARSANLIKPEGIVEENSSIWDQVVVLQMVHHRTLVVVHITSHLC